jgi:hypothetical protein
MISETLLRYVKDNVWCNPLGDRHSVFKPEKVSRKNGNIGEIRISDGRISYKLPDRTSNWHVYVIGHIPPKVLGMNSLEDMKGVWVPISSVMNMDRMMINTYTKHGVQLPRFDTFIQWTTNKNLIIAVPRLHGLLDLNGRDFFVRFYANAYFASVKWDKPTAIETWGRKITSTSDRVQLQNKFTSLKANGYGHVSCIVDGVLIKKPSELTVPIGSWAEVVFDGSVRDIVRVKASEIHAFTSELDSARKFLIHIPKGIGSPIHYKDDIDFILYKKTSTNIQDGVYYHNNVEKHQNTPSVRMVTGHDYSLPVSYVEDYVANLPMFNALEDVEMDVVIRHTQKDPVGVTDKNRVNELYRNSDERIIDILTERTMAVPLWTAANLEKSEYNTLMRSRFPTDEVSVIEKGLGYHTLTRVLNEVPRDTRVDASLTMMDIPVASSYNGVNLLYDDDRKLLDIVSTQNTTTSVVSGTVKLTESFPGKLATIDNNSIQVDIKYADIPKSIGYRCYKTDIVNGDPTDNWVLAVEGTDYQINDQGTYQQIEWLISLGSNYVAVVTDEFYDHHQYSFDDSRDYIEFGLPYRHKNRDGGRNDVLTLPPASLRVWLNKRELVPGIDFHYDWPRIVIVNMNHANEMTPRVVDVLTHGYPEDPTQYTHKGETGFVTYGQVSWNKRYDVHDNRVLYINVGGKLLKRSEVVFDEDYDGIHPVTEMNGLPYCVDTPIITLPLTSGDPMVLREDDLQTDVIVETYLNDHLPKDSISNPNVIPYKYMVVSPFFNRVMTDLITGEFTTPIPDDVTDTWLQTVLNPYKYLLHFDPAYLGFDERFMHIMPHAQTSMDLTRKQWLMLVRANWLFLNDKVEIHDSLRIIGG